MSQKHEGWGWMLAVDFFFAGMGGAMLLIAGVTDLFVGEGRTSALASFLGAAFMALGSALLIFELGRPFQSWRVFMNPKAILTVGAWVMSLAIGAGLVYTTFSFAVFPWSDAALLRQLVAAFMIAAGLVEATYPGVLLGRLKGRPLWAGPGLTALFLNFFAVTAFAAHFLCGFAVAPAKARRARRVPGDYRRAVGLAAVAVVQLPVGEAQRDGGRVGRRRAPDLREYSASSNSSSSWWVRCWPLVAALMPSATVQAAAALLALLGGLVMRNLVVYAGGADRTCCRARSSTVRACRTATRLFLRPERQVTRRPRK
jgi:formate-dependent nitrite reductase membrane component NrfD